MGDVRQTVRDSGRLVVISAVADNGVIGRDGGMPWKLPGDLRRFRAKTKGNAVVMGRRTFKSAGRLDERMNLVLTSDPDGVEGASADKGTTYHAPLKAVRSLDAALEAFVASGRDRLYCCGGAGVYRDCLPMAGELDITRVHAEPDGDVRFPAEAVDDHFALVAEHPAPRHESAELLGDDEFTGEVPYTYRRYVREDLMNGVRHG